MSKVEQKEKNTVVRVWQEYKLHLSVIAVVLIAETIGTKKIPLGNGSITFLPLVFAMIIGLLLYLFKPVFFLKEREATVAESVMLLFLGPLLAKMGIASGQSIVKIFEVGPALLLQEFGNLLTIFIGLPIALLLGFKRESVGLTHSIGREQNLGLIIDKYGFSSSETRGVMMIYIIGTMIGSIIIGPLTSLLATILPLDPRAYAMASGVGSAGMTAASMATLIDLFPELTVEMEAYSSMSNLLTQVDGIYMSIFIGLPLCNKLYYYLEPKIGRIYKSKVNDEGIKSEEGGNL